MDLEYGSDVVNELESLLDSNEIKDIKDKQEFEESIRQMLAFIRSEKEICNLEETGINFVDVIRGALAIADIALKIADFVPFSFPIKIAFKVTLGISSLIFGRKVISKTIQDFQTVLDHEIIGNARTRLHDYKARLIYTQGLVDDIQNAPNQEEKDLLLADVAKEESVMAGIKDIALVQTKIEDILHEGDIDQFSKLMAQVELYCSLTSLHETLLLYRIAILSTHRKQTGRLLKLLYAQRENHENVLAFLCKPTRQNVGYFLKFKEKEYSLTTAFIGQRKLLDGMLKKLFYLLDGQCYQIISVKYKEAKVSLKCTLVLTCARCSYDKMNEPETKFELQSGGNNTIEVIGGEMFLSDGLWIRGSYTSVPKTKWRIVPVELEESEEEQCYLLSPAASENTRCMRVDYTGRVYTAKYKPGDDNVLWYIKRVDSQV